MPQPRRCTGIEPAPNRPIRARSARDRAVIFDPGCAPLLQPLIGAEHLTDFALDEATDWTVAIDRALITADGWPDLLRRRPGLGQFLADSAAAERDLAPPLALDAALPWLIAMPDGSRLALTATRCVAAAPLIVLPAASACELALFSSPRGRAAIANGIDTAPQPDSALEAELSELATTAQTVQRIRLQLQRDVVRRILADFAPPGVRAADAFADWPTIDFATLAERVSRVLHNPIPGRFVALWQQRLSDAQQQMVAQSAELTRLQQAIARLADPLWSPASD